MSNYQGVDVAMASIREQAKTNELDYQFVMHCLKNYRSPRAKLTHLLKSESLIRIKKGLYLLGPQFKLSPYCFELLANMIYGPSYVSLERALQFYGLIPEHVEMVTSVTFKVSCEFKTPVGNFSYAHCPLKYYSIGITTQTFSEYGHPLIATREKALVDMLVIRRGKVTSLQEMEHILLEDLRIEEEDLLTFDLKLIQNIYQTYSHSAIYFFEKWLACLQRKR